MPPSAFFGIAAGILAFAEFAVYIWTIAHDRTKKPARATWFILVGVQTMLWVSYGQVGGGEAIWVSAAYAVATCIVALLSIWRGVGGWTPEEKACLAAAAVALLAWAVTGSAAVGLFATVIADGIAMGITIVKTWHRPQEESRLAWNLGLAANLVNLGAIPRWDLTHAVYPVYLLLAVGTVAVLTLRRPHRAADSASPAAE